MIRRVLQACVPALLLALAGLLPGGCAGLVGMVRAPEPTASPAEEEEGAEEQGEETNAEENGEEASTKEEAEEERRRANGPLEPLIEWSNPGRFHRLLDEALGCPEGIPSNKPAAPEIPEPVFFELIRPMGALKYENELNYLNVAPFGKTPAAQFAEFEYVFADWNAAKIELEFSEGALETIEPGYQLTFGVGPRGNWVHGFQMFPEIYMRERFLGGTGVYMLGWKPRVESRWSVLTMLGANRVLVEERGLAEALGPGLGTAPEAVGGRKEAPPVGVWRPLVICDLAYVVSEKLQFGMENDFFLNRTYPEHLIMPFVNWFPTEHWFLQFGAGYYRLGSHEQLVAMVHINLVNLSPRKPRRVR